MLREKTTAGAQSRSSCVSVCDVIRKQNVHVFMRRLDWRCIIHHLGRQRFAAQPAVVQRVHQRGAALGRVDLAGPEGLAGLEFVEDEG